MEKIRILEQVDREVAAADFGDSWPFTVPSGILRAVKFNALSGPSEVGPMTAVLLEVPSGTVYGINGSANSWAKEFGWENVHPIRMNEGGLGLKKDIGGIIALGLSLVSHTPSGLTVTSTTLN